MDIRKYFGSGNVQKPSNTSVVPIEQKAEARYDISESLPKKKGTQNTKSSWRNKKEESKPTLLKQMSTASQHISDVEEVDFPEVDQKRVKKKAPKLVEAKIKSTENKVFKDNAKTAFGIGDETSGKNNPDDKSKSTQYKTSKISKKVQGSLKRRHENDVSEDEDIQAPRKKKNVVASDSDEDPLPATCRLKRESRSSYFNETFTRVVPKLMESSAVHVPEIEQKKKKPISSMDFFGFSPVQQKEGRHLVEKTTTNSRNFQEEIKGSLTLNKKSFGKRKREEEEENHIIDGDLKEATCKRPLKEAPLTVTSARGSNEVNMSDLQSPARMIKPDVDSPARSAKKDEDRRKSYLAFMNREPPKALGSKEIPQGEENCLEGLTFVMTGVLESIERDDCKSLIERYGGKVTTSISRNTKYLIVGRDSGISKIAKANELKTKQINEDELFELLRTLPGKRSKYELKYEAEKESSKKSNKKPLLSASASSPASKSVSSEKKEKQDKSETKKARETHLSSSSEQPFAKIETSRSKDRKVEVNESSLLWVDKYKPISMKNIIGQQGDKSQAKKLYNWLLNWHKNMNKKPIYGRPSEDGCGFKAALLSGPPGIGKTTTAHLVCQEAGFSFFELNASDTRSKKSLKEFVSEALNCHSLHSFFNEAQDKKAVTLDGKKHCLVMDEVDGMAGNEDRGGVQEVIQLIKTSHVPVICMCNDRNHPKIRSLANHCFDLRFQRPRVEQIKGSMMSIAFKEGLKIPPPALNEIIIAANQDIRQVIHNLSMWSVKDKNLTFDQLKQDASRAQKDLHFSPFDVCRKVFSGGEDSRKMTLNDKSDLFFHDYNIAPLFVHENYLSVKPHNAQCDSWKHLKLLGEAANSMSMGDLVDGHVRRKQNWGLLPTQAMLASVIPGECLRGAISGMITFPSWLGKNSTTNKNNRILQELTLHTSLSASCNKQSLNLDYLPAMKHLITRPLIDGGAAGVEAVVTIMNSYNLLREDFDNIIELSSWSDSKDVMCQVDSKVKAAFTRSYNKESHMLPYSNIVIKKSRKGASAGGIEDLEDDDETLEVGEEEQEDDVTTDAMIMAKKPSKSRSKNEKIPDKPPSKKGKQDQKKTRK